MALHQNTNPLQGAKNLARSILGKQPQKPQEDYDSMAKERDSLKSALAAERCARTDTEERCKALYNELEKEKNS